MAKTASVVRLRVEAGKARGPRRVAGEAQAVAEQRAPDDHRGDQDGEEREDDAVDARVRSQASAAGSPRDRR